MSCIDLTQKVCLTKSKRLDFLSHTFACHSFVQLAEEGVDLYCSWPYLAAYLGHRSLESTERYVRLTANLYPDLLKDGHTMYTVSYTHLTLPTIYSV